MPTPWDEDPADAGKIAANAASVLTDIAAESGRRDPPTVDMAKRWHRGLYKDIARPFGYYAGEVRDSDANFPDLIGYEVQVGNVLGVDSSDVPQALADFERHANIAASRLDSAIPVGIDPWLIPPAALHSVLTFCAILHGNWVRIHPFANGNGRTARLWANWAALRYGIPPFITVKPRPGHPYGAAAAASMRGDDSVMLAVMEQMLRVFLAGLP